MASAAIAMRLLAVAAVVAEEDLRTKQRLHQGHREEHQREVHCVQVCWGRNLDVVEVAQLRLEDCAERHD